MWKDVKSGIAARVVDVKRWTRVGRRRSKHLRNVFALLLLVVGYALRARSERKRWDRLHPLAGQ
jgi:hypothetical protein